MNNKTKEIHFWELENVFDELGIFKNRYEFCGISAQQYCKWKKKGKVPSERFWAFQKEMCIFLDKENLRKKVALGLIDKEYLKELIDG